MFDSIPIEYYEPIFYYTALVIILYFWVIVNRENELPKSTSLPLILVIGLIFYIGLRPINGEYFGDMGVYARIFENFRYGQESHFDQDPGFDLFTKICSRFTDTTIYFLICTLLYVGCHYIAAKKIFNDYWFYAFIFFIIAFSFWAYGTNGIRNGIASSIILMAFAYEKNKKVAISLAIIGVSFHKATLLPVLAYFLTFIYNKPKFYLMLWFLSIPLSLIASGFFEGFFATLGFDDDRLGYLTEGNVNDDEFSSIGFRWDFLVYSSIAVFTGWYFIIKKGYEEILYHRIYNVYLISNAFWILIIRANFSNRFAYLSWFMLSLVVVYPFLKMKFMNNQAQKFINVMVVYFLFTFLMNVVLSKK